MLEQQGYRAMTVARPTAVEQALQSGLM